MKLETLLTLAAVGGIGYLLWDKFGAGVWSGTAFRMPVELANRPFPAGGVIPAGTPMPSPDCQLPCPPGVSCAAVLDGVRDTGGNCGPLKLRMN